MRAFRTAAARARCRGRGAARAGSPTWRAARTRSARSVVTVAERGSSSIRPISPKNPAEPSPRVIVERRPALVLPVDPHRAREDDVERHARVALAHDDLARAGSGASSPSRRAPRAGARSSRAQQRHARRTRPATRPRVASSSRAVNTHLLEHGQTPCRTPCWSRAAGSSPAPRARPRRRASGAAPGTCPARRA